MIAKPIFLESAAPHSFPTMSDADGKKFEAPDGKTFESQRKLNKYLYATYYSLKDKEGENVLRKPGEING